MKPSSSIRHVILGMLGRGPRSGYDIKQLVDRSTRFFWAASFGQIYPELRRLEVEGLIERHEEPDPDARGRTVYRLTARGREELERWLAEPAAELRYRDEWLLKIFFSEPGPQALRHLHDMAAERQRAADELRSIRELAGSGPARLPADVLEYGISLHEWVAAWARRLASELTSTPAAPSRDRPPASPDLSAAASDPSTAAPDPPGLRERR